MPLSTGWEAISIAPENEILASVRRAQWTGVTVTTSTVLFAGALAWLAATYCLRPVEELISAAETTSHGNWGCRVEENMPGELGTLARTFNRMSRELEVSYRSVEEVAEHRARELKTERKNAQATDARLAAIVESSEDAIIGQTLDGIITSWERRRDEAFRLHAGGSDREAGGNSPDAGARR